MSRILVVDDEEAMREFLRILLEKDGHQVTTAADGEDGLALATGRELDLVISDIKMPRRDGVGLLAGLREHGLDTPVIMVTAYASSDSAIQAMKQGAFDYITKPFKVDEIRLVIQRALARVERRPQVEPTAPPRLEEAGLRGIIGKSPKMVELYKLISRVAVVDSTIMITGESGTGKELVARTIHGNSPRAGKPFMAINCGAIPEELLESELFGHVKGSFTGATANKAGLLEVARGGTVFLDEIAEMSPMLQVKLLRFLQDHIFRRVGGTEDMEVDVRMMAATNKDLTQLIQQGSFREDLYYRLNVIPVELPPLRERREDILVLATNFLGFYAAKAGRSAMEISPEAVQVLMAYSWPGNVRELENAIERAVALATTDEVQVENLPPSICQPAPVPPRPRWEVPPEGLDLEQVVADLEKALMKDALEKAGGIQTRAAQLLGINFRSFRYRAKKYGLDRQIRDRDHADS
ncbi:MAG: sigma-54-dependent Fis family transcriptional regulator [candidate division NC10 bacterium]|nr:sigma-54-dependent Fis family transcriptional regulator [candidate division NC10 bacterium]MBI2113898.1 sigma-54-dependent Fis family transcriptional regulator [candidate division NC10 bacterium]MBI2458728.1 sigma-54-dependent Fis family transcriptional regulator [candidate division NC10 bacterium]MBI2564165.1 sigma-54-dependent Fis family transcriptional regulator [candidate division NC10 bacterium]